MKIKNNNLEINLSLFCIFIGTLLPSSITQLITLKTASLEIRLNSILISLILIFLMFLSFIRREKVRLLGYEKRYIYFCGYCFFFGIIKLLFNGEYILFSSLLNSIAVLLFPFFIYYFICSNIKDITEIDFVYKVIVFIGDLVSMQLFLINIFSFFLGWNITPKRGITTIGVATSTGLFLVCIFFISLYMQLEKPSFFYKASTIFILFGILKTETRSAILILCLILIYLIFFMKIKKLKLILGCLIITIIVVIFNKELMQNIYLRIALKTSNGSNELRYEFLMAGLKKIKSNFFLGTGIGLGIKRLEQFRFSVNQITNPHNQHIGIFIETGFIGLLLYNNFIYKIIKFYKKNKFKFSVLLLNGFILFYIIGFMFELIILGDIRNTMMFWILLIGLRLSKKRREIYEKNRNIDISLSRK